MSVPMTEKDLKEQTEARLEALREKAQQCVDDLHKLIQRQSLKALVDPNLPPVDKLYMHELHDFYVEIAKHVENIKNISESMQVPPTAHEIERLERAINRTLDDYAAYNSHLEKSQRDYPENSNSTKLVAREMLFEAKQGCIKFGRMLSDLARSATSFCRSAEKLAAETRRMREIHEAQTKPEALTARQAAKVTLAAGENASKAVGAVSQVIPNSVKKRATKVRSGISKFIPSLVKKHAEAIAEDIAEVVEQSAQQLAEAAKDPVLEALKNVGKNLETKIDDHNDIIRQQTVSVQKESAAEVKRIEESREQRKQKHAPTIKAIAAKLDDTDPAQKSSKKQKAKKK